jgi:hypothetical protein
VDLPLFLYSCYQSFEYSLSHLRSHFKWPTQGTVSPPTTLRTMGRTTTKTPTCRHPLRLLLSKCWLCKHKYFRPYSRPWSTYMLNPKHHHRRGIGLDIFSAPSRQPFLMLWSQLMLMAGSSLLRRSCKWCSATTMRRCCWSLTSFLVLQPTDEMLKWEPMRNLRASTSQNLEFLSVHIMFPKGLLVIPHSEKEGTKPPYMCTGCSNHTYSNNMITRIDVQ